MEPGKGTTLLATESTPQTQLFVSYVNQQLQRDSFIVAPQAPGEAFDLAEEESDSQTVVLLDIDHLEETAMQEWQAQHHQQPGWLLTAFNLRNEEHAAQLLSLMQLKGIFYRSDSLGLPSSGASNTKIAGLLYVSVHTAKSHLYNIFRKINVNNRMQAVNWARQNLGPPHLLSRHGYDRTLTSH